MECPSCTSQRIFKDYAPARCYWLTLLGIIILLPLRLLQPDLLLYSTTLTPATDSALAAPISPVNLLMVLGIAAIVIGIIDMARHENRYCRECGFRFRMPKRRNNSENGMMPRRSLGEVRPGERRKGEVNPNQPIEPLLKCLHLKNEAMRKESAATLTKLTGQDLGEDADAWEKWWAENKEEYKARRKGWKGDA